MSTPTAATPATATPSAEGGVPGAPLHASGSLYVGDLQTDVTEALLFEVFNQVGPVSSIRVCRDASSRVSLGYAYVNFHNVVDAERALDTLNFTPIKDRPCRIMWSRRDPSARKNTNSNIFLKNLDASVDNKSLYDTFSAYGNILSCKVAMDEANQSKEHAFVHFETEEAALKAIEAVNGMILNGKKVTVCKFERRSERPGGNARKFTNLYVKEIPTEWNEAKLRGIFEKWGEVDSLLLRVGEDGKHAGFGFVNYKTHEEAAKAMEEANKIVIPGSDPAKTLFADRFQKKAERQAVLQKRREERRREKNELYGNVNLYVKNLEEDMTSDGLKEMFASYGNVTSAVVMTEGGVSKLFGFVCFENAEDATKALGALNGKMMGTKPLYVNRAQRKEDRRRQLEIQFQANMRMQPMAPVFYGPPGGMMAQGGMMFSQQQRMMQQQQRYAQHGMRGGNPGYPYHPQQMKRGGRPPQQNRQGGVAGARPTNPQKGGYRPAYHQQPVAAPLPAAAPVQPDLTALLTEATPEVQKQMLGERLFPLVQRENQELAGKITGMLLEMDVADILPLTESQSELSAKIDEAMRVLKGEE